MVGLVVANSKSKLWVSLEQIWTLWSVLTRLLKRPRLTDVGRIGPNSDRTVDIVNQKIWGNAPYVTAPFLRTFSKTLLYLCWRRPLALPLPGSIPSRLNTKTLAPWQLLHPLSPPSEATGVLLLYSSSILAVRMLSPLTVRSSLARAEKRWRLSPLRTPPSELLSPVTLTQPWPRLHLDQTIVTSLRLLTVGSLGFGMFLLFSASVHGR